MLAATRGAAVVLMVLLCGCAHVAPRAAPSPLPFVTGAYPEYGHAPNFSWVAGRLTVRPNGCVYLVFDTHHPPPWNGRVALFAQPQTLGRLADGDMIVAFGRLSAAPSGECGAAALDVTNVGEH